MKKIYNFQGVRINSTFSVLRPNFYRRPFLFFYRSTLPSLLRPLYSDHVFRPVVKSGRLFGLEVQVEVKSVGRNSEKVEDRISVEVQKRSNLFVPIVMCQGARDFR